MIEIDKIYHQDCIEGMKLIDDGTVDLLLTDPPYNISMRSGFHTMGRQGVDFGEWDKNFNQTEWLQLAAQKVKKGGSAIIFNDYKNITTMSDVLSDNGFTTKELLIWQKPNPMPRNRDRLYVTSIEVALWAVKGKGWTFNRQRTNYENAIFPYSTVNPRVRKHPTQKPLELLYSILKIHSNEGDLVLDPFSGSGAISIACEHLNRSYIAFEIDDKYYKESIIDLNIAKGLSHGVFQ
jgi:DNA modification methylase